MPAGGGGACDVEGEVALAQPEGAFEEDAHPATGALVCAGCRVASCWHRPPHLLTPAPPPQAPAALALAERVAAGETIVEFGGGASSAASAGAATGIYPAQPARVTGDYTQWGSPSEGDRFELDRKKGSEGDGGGSSGQDESPSASPKIKPTDTRFTPPWIVFLDDLKKKTEDRLNN